ncbi:MAG: hypothetical protein ABJA34_13465 [Pseudonocardiales bacterium]
MTEVLALTGGGLVAVHGRRRAGGWQAAKVAKIDLLIGLVGAEFVLGVPAHVLG